TDTPTDTPTETPTLTPTDTPTETPTPTHTPTETPTDTPTETPTQTPTDTPTPTHTPTETPTPTDTPTPTPTPSPTNTPTPTPTPTSTPTPTETPTPTPRNPVIVKAEAGSTIITGRSDPGPECTAGDIQVFDCGPDGVCYTGDDFQLAIVSATRDALGNFTVVLATPLVARQKVYVKDNCFDPPLVGPVFLVPPPIPIPLLSPKMIMALAATLALMGLVGLRHLRRGA
ncbi:MAG: hypothetical protein ACHQ4J_10860, partial [Candidatus Binatia bacterium]